MRLTRREVLVPFALAFLVATGACTSKAELTPNRSVAAMEQPASPLDTAKLTATLTATPRPIPTIIPPTVPEVPAQKAAPKLPPNKHPAFDSLLELMTFQTKPFQKWRKSVPNDVEVSIIDFGLRRYSGIVRSEEGVKLRQFPAVTSKPALFAKWLDWGQKISFRLKVMFRRIADKQLLESWIVVDEDTQKGVRWGCENGWPRAQGRCFAATQIGEEELIDTDVEIPPPIEEISFYNWPAPVRLNQPTDSTSLACDKYRRVSPQELAQLPLYQLCGSMGQEYANFAPTQTPPRPENMTKLASR